MNRRMATGKGELVATGMARIDLGIMRRLLKFMTDAQLSELDIEMEGVKVRFRKAGEAGPAHAPAPVAAAPVYQMPMAAVAPAPVGPLPASAPAPIPVAAAGGPPGPTAPAAPVAPPAHAGPVVKSPMVGTFYRSPSPTAPPFVNPGDVFKVGQTLCIIEAMKLMNEIKAEQPGKIKRILVENGNPVEFDQVIFELEPA